MGGHEAAVTATVISPDSRWLATASFDGTVRLWNLTTPDFRAIVLTDHTYPVLDVAISDNGRWLATVDNDNTARL